MMINFDKFRLFEDLYNNNLDLTTKVIDNY